VALSSNTTGSSNTANGASALANNIDGSFNSAFGNGALAINRIGNLNTAVGNEALVFNNSDENTAVGESALRENFSGTDNTAIGGLALRNNTEGGANTASGFHALFSNTTGIGNTANGDGALNSNTDGSGNTAVGSGAGAVATGSSNVYIGAGMNGVAGENNACYIASIFGQTSTSGIPVLINSNNKLGTATSSVRFKKDIKPMDNASEALFALKPVTFRYKKEIDPEGISQLGLVAEEVDKVNPELVVRDKEGKPYSVRYDQVNAMLLNEFLKEHRKVEQQQATITQLQEDSAEQREQIGALIVGLQKVSAQLEVSKAAPQTVKNTD
jgi:endosialidase-like protein